MEVAAVDPEPDDHARGRNCKRVDDRGRVDERLNASASSMSGQARAASWEPAENALRRCCVLRRSSRLRRRVLVAHVGEYREDAPVVVVALLQIELHEDRCHVFLYSAFGDDEPFADAFVRASFGD